MWNQSKNACRKQGDLVRQEWKRPPQASREAHPLKLTHLSKWGSLTGKYQIIEPVNETDKNLTACGSTSQAPLPVKFIHEKSQQYRTCHADAVWGTINGLSNIQLEFYLERPPIPSAVVQPVNPDGTYTSEQKLEPIQDAGHFIVVRDFQVGVVLSLQSAIQVHTVLGNFIELAKQQLSMETKK